MELVLSGTTNNNRPVPSGDPAFPAATCDALAEDASPVGAARAYLTSDAILVGSPVGEARMHAEACLFRPPPTVVAELTITADNGDTLSARIKVTRRPDSPAPPDSEATGNGVVTGGTGRFAGASGAFNMNAKSHGAVHPGTNVALFRDIAMCGYVHVADRD